MVAPADDAVAQVFDLPREVPPVLGVGAFLKNTVCVAAGRKAFVSPAVGNLDTVDVSRYAVVGNYTRFDEAIRNALKDARQRIVTGIRQPGRKRENHLLWAAPGSGKTYLVQQIAESLGNAMRYSEINLAKCTESDFRI